MSKMIMRLVGPALFLMLVFLALAGSAFSQTTLTVEKIVEMHKSGVSDQVLITMIQSAGKPFALTPDQVIALTSEKVPQAVIQAMIMPVEGESKGSAPDRTVEVARDPNDPNSAHDSGIYVYFKNRHGQPEMKLLEPAAYTGAKAGGLGNFISRNVTSFVAEKMNAVIQGKQAGIHTADKDPVFFFFFEDKAAALGKSGIFGNLTSPNQFVLVKLKAKDKTREVQIASQSALGAKVGTDEDAVVQFRIERVRPGVYKVMMQQALKPGEYAFMASSAAGGAQFSGAAAPVEIYDFSVPKEQ